jgi:hypothetical protein
MPLKNDFEGSFRGNLDSRRASGAQDRLKKSAPTDSIDARRWHAADVFNRYRPNPDSAEEICSFSRMPQTRPSIRTYC